METELIYLTEEHLYESRATVVGTGSDDRGTYLVLDRTIFYPQGGGQPYDLGTISWEDGEVDVVRVGFVDSQVLHYFQGAPPPTQTQVTLRIDIPRRQLNSKLHTAGHLVDVAMLNCKLDFPPTKGYHFADSPYVEYEGVIPPEDRDRMKDQLNSELARLIAGGSAVHNQIVDSKDKLYELCPFVPDYLPEGKPIRVVTVAQDVGCPCGGTHVSNIRELERVEVHKIKVKSGMTRVSYRL